MEMKLPLRRVIDGKNETTSAATKSHGHARDAGIRRCWSGLSAPKKYSRKRSTKINSFNQ
jgi:hypothetical protein